MNISRIHIYIYDNARMQNLFGNEIYKMETRAFFRISPDFLFMLEYFIYVYMVSDWRYPSLVSLLARLCQPISSTTLNMPRNGSPNFLPYTLAISPALRANVTSNSPSMNQYY